HEWIQTDLGAVSTVRAIQINYADQDVDSSFLGKINGIFGQYKLWQSTDGKNWTILVDKSHSHTDIPQEYVELKAPVSTRFLKLENIHMPTGKFAISGLRVFGNGNGKKPDTVTHFIVLRSENDSRNALIKWFTVNTATGYNIYWGIAPDKLYNSVMVYNDNQYYFKPMDKGRTYYFSIEAFNENGVSPKTKPLEVK
ncbi:MAG: discoidin domain-containing protein, partial [Chitinophagales bacterium]